MIIDDFLSCDISNNFGSTEDDWVSEKFPLFDEDDIRGELGDLLFDSDTDSELDFDGFDEYDIYTLLGAFQLWNLFTIYFHLHEEFGDFTCSLIVVQILN